MLKYCRKCGAELNDKDSVCPKCGYDLNATQKGYSDNSSRFGTVWHIIAGTFVVLILLGIVFYAYEGNITKTIEVEKEETVNDIKTLQSSNSQDTNYEIKKDKVEVTPKKEITYKKYVDKIYKFQIDYPNVLEYPEDVDIKRGSAITYKEELGKGCKLIFGNLFNSQSEDKKFDIYQQMKKDKTNYNYQDKENLKMIVLPDNAYEVFYDDNDFHVCTKVYYGVQGKMGQMHYVRLTYNDDEDKEKIEIGKHMYDSFKPGVTVVK